MLSRPLMIVNGAGFQVGMGRKKVVVSWFFGCEQDARENGSDHFYRRVPIREVVAVILGSNTSGFNLRMEIQRRNHFLRAPSAINPISCSMSVGFKGRPDIFDVNDFLDVTRGLAAINDEFQPGNGLRRGSREISKARFEWLPLWRRC